MWILDIDDQGLRYQNSDMQPNYPDSCQKAQSFKLSTFFTFST